MATDIKITGLAEFATERGLPVGEWFELRIRFKRNADGSADIIFGQSVAHLSRKEVEAMEQKGGLLS